MTTLARHVPNLSDIAWSDDRDVRAQARPGDYEICTEPSGQRRFWFICPGPCKQLSALALRPVIANDPQSWELSLGLDAAPTLTPSINHLGCWHGWLANGVFSDPV